MDQSIAQQFGRALVFLLEKEGWGAQTRLAREKGIDRGYLNAIIQGRKTGSENVRSKIAEYFHMPYDEMLALGRRLLEAPGQKKEQGIMQCLEQTSQNAEIRAGKKNEYVETDPGSLRISEIIQKAIEIFETDSEYRFKLADLIDTFHEALMTQKENAGLSSKLEAMEKRIVDLEKILADEKDGAKKNM
jgi:transcriptional regulator with XRE-family HTH domain